MKNSFIYSLIFSLCTVQALSQKVVRGPYLQVATENSITIKWRTDIESGSYIKYGLEKTNLDRTQTSSVEGKNHEVKISNLTANTRYFYKIADIENPNLDLQYFDTSPMIGQAQPFKIWVVGDAGTADKRSRSVRDAFYQKYGKESMDLMIMLGDNAYDDGLDQEYQAAVFENMYEELLYNTPVWPTPGNHDLRTGLKSPYYDIFTLPTRGEAGGVASGDEQYYSYDYANVHFISMNSQEMDTEPGSPMYQWLEEDLAANVQPWIIAYWHHPPYSWGSHDSDVGGTETRTRENLVPLLESYGVDLVMNGHSHSYERSFLINGHYGTSDTFNPSKMMINGGDGRREGDGVYQKVDTEESKAKGAVFTVAGSSGKISKEDVVGVHPVMVNKIMRLGSVILEIDNNILDFSFLMDDGTVGDHFTLIKEKSSNKSPKFTSVPIEVGIEHEPYSYRVLAEDPEGDTISFAAIELPSWLTFDPVTGILSGAPGDFDIGSQFVTLGAYDGTSTSTQSFEIKVDNVNDQPIFISTPVWGTSEEVSYFYQVEAFDPDPSDKLVITFIEGPDWLSYDQKKSQLKGKPLVGDQGIYQATLSLLDNVGNDTTFQTFEIEVRQFNYPPDFVSNPEVQAVEGEQYSYKIELIDQNGDDIHIEFSKLPSWLTFDPSTRILTGIPENPDVGYNKVKILATDKVVEDPTEQKFSIKVINVNDPPVVVSEALELTAAGVRFEYIIEVEDPDNDEDDIEFEWKELPDWLSYRKSNKRFRGTPELSDVGYYCIEGTFTDGELNNPISYRFCFFVVNDLTTVALLSKPRETCTEDALYCYEVGLYIPESSSFEPVLLSEVPQWLTFDPVSNKLCGTPTQNEIGTHPIDLVFAVGSDTVTQNFNLEVIEVNDSPIYLNQSTLYHRVEEEAYFESTFEFSDEENDSIVFEIGNLPSWLKFDYKTMILAGRPTHSEIGTYQIGFKYRDNRQEEFIHASFNIKVVEINQKPVFDSEPDLIVKEDSAYNYQVKFSDKNLDAQLDFQVAQIPAWLSIDRSSLILTGIPSNDDVGIHKVVLTLSDGIAEATIQEFYIEVLNMNDPIELLSEPIMTVREDEAYFYQILVKEVDLNDSLLVEVLFKPDWLFYDQVKHSFSGTPTNDHIGVNFVEITLRDLYMKEGLEHKFEIDVSNVNDKPIFLNQLNRTLAPGNEMSFQYQTFDEDENDQVKLSFNGLPVWIDFVDSISTIKIAEDVALEGVYEWTVTAYDLEGAESLSKSVLRVEVPQIPDDLALTSKVFLYPNPMEGTINFKVQDLEAVFFEAYLMDLNGKELEYKILNVTSEIITWELEKIYAQGTYIVQLISSTGFNGQFLINAK